MRNGNCIVGLVMLVLIRMPPPRVWGAPAPTSAPAGQQAAAADVNGSGASTSSPEPLASALATALARLSDAQAKLKTATDAALLRIHDSNEYRQLLEEWRARDAVLRQAHSLDASAKVKDTVKRIGHLEATGLGSDSSVVAARSKVADADREVTKIRAMLAEQQLKMAEATLEAKAQAAADAADAAARDEGPTLAKYYQIKTGMSYADVKAIMGYAGVKQIGTPYTATISWSSRSGLNNITVTFTSNGVESTAQFGLGQLP